MTIGRSLGVQGYVRGRSGPALLCLALGTMVMLGACYETHPCEAERCDGRDNDCDTRIDEDFRDSRGRYVADGHCGACQLACADVFPSASETRCELNGGAPQCVLTACPAGSVMSGAGACVEELAVLCLPCEADRDCTDFRSDARCIRDGTSGRFCSHACGAEQPCPEGFRCVRDVDGRDAQCQPLSGSCLCEGATLGATFGCELLSPTGDRCLGQRLCSPAGLSACAPAVDEACNELDDDCDGAADEDFVDIFGRLTSAAHCGSCDTPCVAPGPNMQASCVLRGAEPSCDVDCLPGFVDVDGLSATGCECELQSGPAVTVGSDRDCDGVIDPTPDYVFVSVAGDDNNSGTEADAPLATVQAGLALAQQLSRTLLIARGPYRGRIELFDGATVFGGYSPDFRARDLGLYPVVFEGDSQPRGRPVLLARDIRTTTVLDGVTVFGAPGAGVGQGSTAVLIDGATAALSMHDVTVYAATGGTGLEGDPSSARLSRVGVGSLAELAGSAGGAGRNGNAEGVACPAEVQPGDGGGKVCSGADVGGGRGGGAVCAALPGCDNNGGGRCGNAGCTDFTVGGVCDIEAALAQAVGNPRPGSGRGAQPGRAGEVAYNSPTNHGDCSFCDDNPTLRRTGDDGGDGASGRDGSGGAACTAVSSLDAEGRLTAAAGGAGVDGESGSGGGGGSAGAGYAVIANTTGTCNDSAGGSGGGGGSGGCGSPGGGGGGGGGTSVGIVVRLADDSGPDLTGVRVITAAGGDGGAGGAGAEGGAGGLGGLGGLSQFWCSRRGGSGGDGGSGGAGGGGAGGCGGGSFGLYVVGSSASAERAFRDQARAQVQVDPVGAPGRGGAAGRSPGQSGRQGSPGSQLDIAIQSLF